MKTADFDYELPSELIAQTPIEPRDASRLLVLDRASGQLAHRIFRDIGEHLRPGDLLVANESRVIPARLHARKVPTGGKVELLLVAKRDERTWEVLVKGRKLVPGHRLAIGDGERRVVGQVLEITEAGGRLIAFERPIEPLLDELGIVPLPPYIHTPLTNAERYQTVYARREGSVAAPTAGLHFTPELLSRLQETGVHLAFITLDIGLDTFRPVREDQVEDHVIHTERCQLDPQVAQQINKAKQEGRRVIAVGTTTVRVLETAAVESGVVQPFTGPTDLFIYPGFQFRVVDALITNFHLPRSTLLMLVCAFAGRELIFKAYREAVRERYRFYSFGDAMLIL
ncbi:MAG TPA: tRNA preQ1(34) S-adenosylmethionine ribosyltransferase-isomerase QueA [Anaerolineae bacterium]|nr:tRNA preQ1(34) S-adenosylmethionine ribosyltransferase-isomerase QueA [Anaerolineae bacterium]